MRVILHVGASKTGSSALQSAFVQYRESLCEKGIHYPIDPYEHLLNTGRILSGNGLSLAAKLQPRLLDHPLWETVPEWRSEHDLDEAIRYGCETILYSSEFMASVEHECLEIVAQEISDAGCRLEVIYVVRDITPHAVSSFHQSVRQGRFDGTVEEYICEAYRPPFSAQLERWNAGADCVQVMHYDSCKSRLLPAFLEFIGYSSEGAPNAPRVNASKTETTLLLPSAVRAKWEREVQTVNEKYRPHPEPLSI